MGFPWTLAVAIGVPEFLGSLVGQSTRDNLLNWFATLKKPSWEPPGPLFGIAWTILYGVMGYASWRVWLCGGWQANQAALSLYVLQLVLNLSWPLVFFNGKKLGEALALNLAVLATAAATASKFYKVDPLAGKLMLPYLAWLAFANALNYAVWQMNPQATSNVEDLSRPASKRNPGEQGYNTSPGTTAAYVPCKAGNNVHSRSSTVRVVCNSAPHSISRPAHAARLVKAGQLLGIRGARPAHGGVGAPAALRFV